MSRNHDRFQTFGLHPLVAFGVVAVDMMLFGGEASTGGVSWALSVAVAVTLAVPVALLQRYAYRDDWGTAVGKATLLALLTAIPTPIPSIFPAAAGVLGMFRRPALPEHKPEPEPARALVQPAMTFEPEGLDTELQRVIDKHRSSHDG